MGYNCGYAAEKPRERAPRTLRQDLIMHRTSRSALATLLGSILLAGPLAAATQGFHAPPIDPGRYAVRHAGLAGDGVQELGFEGWQVVELPEPVARAGGSRAVARGLAEAGYFATPVYLGENGGPLLPTPELLLRVREWVSPAAARGLFEVLEAGEVLDEEFGGMARAWRLDSGRRSGEEVLELVARLARRPEIEWVEPDWIVSGGGDWLPNDPDFDKQWGLKNTGQYGGIPGMDLGMEVAWNTCLGDPAVQVVVLDTGVQLDHPDLNLAPGRDFTSDGPAGAGGVVNVCDLHGTLVAGCISAKADDGYGIAGVAPACRVASARCFISVVGTCNGTWNARLSWTIAALDWAAEIGAPITNNSNYYNLHSLAVEAKYAETREAGILHFAAAGNAGTSIVTWPARLPSTLAVAAMTPGGLRAGFSNWGPEIDLCAPGQTIYTTDRTGTDGLFPGDHGFVNGTSFASPYASAAAALLLSAYPGLTANQLEARLKETTRDLGPAGWDAEFGWGLVRADEAIASCTAWTSYCEGGTHSGGGTATISATGSTNLAANDLVLATTGALPGELGSFFFGSAPAEIPFGGGTLCVGGWARRLGQPLFLDGGGAATLAVDLTSTPVAILPGSTWYFQFSYRDPQAANGERVNFSDALEITFCP